MGKCLLIFVCCCLHTAVGFAQTGYVRQLKALIQQNKQDSASALAYNRLVLMGEDYGVPSTDTMVEKALQVSQRSNSKAQTAFALLNKALAMTKNGKYDTALYTTNRAKDILNQTDTSKNTESLSIYYFTRGMILLPQGSFKEETLASFLKALELSKKTDFKYLTAICYSGVGKAYDYLRQFEHEIDNNKAFLAFAGRSPVDTLILAKAYNNLGSAYLNAGDKTTATRYFKDFEQLLPRLQSPYMSWLFYNNTAHRLMEDEQYKEAIQNALQAIEIAKANLSPFDRLATYYLLGYIHFVDNDFSKSKSYMDSTYTIAEEAGSKEYVMYAASALAEIEGKLGNYKSAAEYLTLQLNLSDSISNDKSKINANFLTIQYQTAQKEAQIELQQATIQQKNTLNYILFGSAAALALILLLGYRNYQHKQKLQKVKIAELETEKQLLATQSLLKGQADERSRLAKDLHDGLGGMLSGVKLQLGAMKGNLILTEENGMLFNSALNKLDESISEMRRVAHNMMPEALIRLGLEQALQDYCKNIGASGAFVIDTELHGLEQRLDATTEVTIYRIVQELVNNAIKHSGAEQVLVQVVRHDKSLTITVEDNGKGFDTTSWEQKDTTGLQNIRSRVNYLRGHMDVKSQPGKGTSVYIECTIEDNG
ncbi:sensor histidine kinase [Olivibacter sitiensis]|uniref:ATP-binding protein n=1 Tax=Olivibacter sitiensis TaxID=376470 RepID=UPI0004212F84|nr:sensor histidine kinase [Olivibacter sitiensis]